MVLTLSTDNLELMKEYSGIGFAPCPTRDYKYQYGEQAYFLIPSLPVEKYPGGKLVGICKVVGQATVSTVMGISWIIELEKEDADLMIPGGMRCITYSELLMRPIKLGEGENQKK